MGCFLEREQRKKPSIAFCYQVVSVELSLASSYGRISGYTSPQFYYTILSSTYRKNNRSGLFSGLDIFLLFFVQIGLILLLGSEDGHEVLRTEDFRMTDYQKKRIRLLRCQNVGYAMIAKELKLSIGAVKQYCRRNGLQSDGLEADTQPENISEITPAVDLINVEKRGNSTTANRPGSLENTGFSDGHPICEVTVSFADKADETAVADVLNMLMHVDYGR